MRILVRSQADILAGAAEGAAGVISIRGTLPEDDVAAQSQSAIPFRSGRQNKVVLDSRGTTAPENDLNLACAQAVLAMWTPC